MMDERTQFADNIRGRVVSALMAAHEARYAEAQAEIERLRKDEARLDWLADPNNHIGNVQLPEEVVLQNIHSLRDAIDAAMEMGDG